MRAPNFMKNKNFRKALEKFPDEAEIILYKETEDDEGKLYDEEFNIQHIAQEDCSELIIFVRIK